MSIEQKIEALTAAIAANTDALLALAQSKSTPAAAVTNVIAESETVTDTKKPAADAKKAKKAEAEAKAAAKAKEDDGLGEGGDDDDLGGEREYTLTEMKELLLKVKDKAGDKKAALDILNKFGYAGVPSVQQKDATAIARAALAALED